MLKIFLWPRVSNGTSAGPPLTYSNLGNLSGGNLGWEERPVVEHRSSRDESSRKPQPQTPSADHGHVQQGHPQLIHGSHTTSSPSPQQPQHQSQTQQQQHHALIQRNSRPEITDLVEAMHNLRTRKKLEREKHVF